MSEDYLTDRIDELTEIKDGIDSILSDVPKKGFEDYVTDLEAIKFEAVKEVEGLEKELDKITESKEDLANEFNYMSRGLE